MDFGWIEKILNGKHLISLLVSVMVAAIIAWIIFDYEIAFPVFVFSATFIVCKVVVWLWSVIRDRIESYKTKKEILNSYAKFLNVIGIEYQEIIFDFLTNG